MHASGNVSVSGAKLKLVEAAESLFAEKGFEAVAVREITTAAGANIAAVNYHFGSREGLVALVMRRHLTPMNDERLLRLDAAERQWGSKAVPIEEVLDAFARPLINRITASSGLSEKLFGRLIGRIFAAQSEGMPPELEAQCNGLIDRFSKALAKSLPGVPPEDVAWRLHFIRGGLIHLLTHAELVQRGSGAPGMDAVMSRFLRFAAAGLREGRTEEAPPATQPSPQAMFDF